VDFFSCLQSLDSYIVASQRLVRLYFRRISFRAISALEIQKHWNWCYKLSVIYLRNPSNVEDWGPLRASDQQCGCRAWGEHNSRANWISASSIVNLPNGNLEYEKVLVVNSHRRWQCTWPQKVKPWLESFQSAINATWLLGCHFLESCTLPSFSSTSRTKYYLPLVFFISSVLTRASKCRTFQAPLP
jgi:hypothetical protein